MRLIELEKIVRERKNELERQIMEGDIRRGITYTIALEELEWTIRQIELVKEQSPANAPSDSPIAKVCDSEDALKHLPPSKYQCTECDNCLGESPLYTCRVKQAGIERYLAAKDGECPDFKPKVSEQSRKDGVKKCPKCRSITIQKSPYDDCTKGQYYCYQCTEYFDIEDAGVTLNGGN